MDDDLAGLVENGSNRDVRSIVGAREDEVESGKGDVEWAKCAAVKGVE